ncbi:LysR family transcriptional regulator [Cupriavidus sp. USMAHM13]|uniref:LysR family transcriptional regulator n=1 Tax=Cupriavidus sp. USMAHM13 TaxID=1389192 RepID=UPI0008A66D3B|nr:LysR family transcriptional regulator [Cupriavidus sp. USMAHM13]AOZ01846.1 LysR family transcriptional regulator [Cupriavidus sp. USMAHM13]
MSSANETIQWNDWEAFCSVVEYGTFTAAAEQLECPKSRVSAAVARLEDAIGAKLLERTTRRMRLTDAGSAVYRDVAPLFARLREIRQETLAREERVQGVLRIATPYEFGAQQLGGVICRTLAAYPELDVSVETAQGLVDPIRDGFDIAFVAVDADLPDSGTVARRIYHVERGLFAAPALAATLPQAAVPEQLANLPVLTTPGDTVWEFTYAGERVSVPIHPRMQTFNAELRLQGALAGLGIARLALHYCEAEVAQGRLVRVLPEFTPPPLRVFALLPDRRLQPRKVRAFMEEVESMLAAHEQAGIAIC